MSKATGISVRIDVRVRRGVTERWTIRPDGSLRPPFADVGLPLHFSTLAGQSRHANRALVVATHRALRPIVAALARALDALDRRWRHRRP